MGWPSEEPQVGEGAQRQQVHVQVCQHDRPQRQPEPQAVVDVERAHPAPQGPPDGGPRERVHRAAADVPAGVAAKGVQRQEGGVGKDDERPEPRPDAVLEPEGQSDIVPVDDDDGEHEPEEVAVDVLQDPGEPRLPRVRAGPVAHRARGRRPDHRSIVRLPRIVAGQPEAERHPDDEQRGCEAPPRTEDCGQGMLAVRGEARRVERRDVRRHEVVRVHERAPGRVDDEQSQADEDGQDLPQPGVTPERRRRVRRGRRTGRRPHGAPLICDHAPQHQPPPPPPCSPGSVICSALRISWSCSADRFVSSRATSRIVRPVVAAFFAISAALSYPMTGASAVVSMSPRSTSSAARGVAAIPATHCVAKLPDSAARRSIDHSRLWAMTGIIVFSSKLPHWLPRATTRSLPCTCAQAWMTDSAMTGLTLPGMIEDPGCTAGRASSPSPARGPLPIQRMSFAIFMNAVAYVRRTPEVNTSASRAACAWKWFVLSRISTPRRLDSHAQARRAYSGWVLVPVPTAVPPRGTSRRSSSA